MKKKLMAIILSVVLLLTLYPFQAMASQDIGANERFVKAIDELYEGNTELKVYNSSGVEITADFKLAHSTSYQSGDYATIEAAFINSSLAMRRLTYNNNTRSETHTVTQYVLIYPRSTTNLNVGTLLEFDLQASYTLNSSNRIISATNPYISRWYTNYVAMDYDSWTTRNISASRNINSSGTSVTFNYSAEVVGYASVTVGDSLPVFIDHVFPINETFSVNVN